VRATVRRWLLGADAPPISSRGSPWYWLWLLLHNPGAVLGGLIVLAVALLGFVGPSLTHVDPLKANIYERILPPSAEHPLGTDRLGRDVWARLLYGARVSMVVGLGTTFATTVFGTLLGLVSGYFPLLDGLIMRVMDGLMAFPNLMLAIAIMAVRGPGVGNVILAVTVSSTPRLARLVRGQVLTIRARAFVEAARSIGATPWRIILRHILPNSMALLIVRATFNFAVAVLVESGMSFLGAGVPPQVPAWGNMLQEGVHILRAAPWVSIFPGMALAITVLGLNLLGDGLRDALDPWLYGR
jgi:peptide/nickel transport system permease protein